MNAIEYVLNIMIWVDAALVAVALFAFKAAWRPIGMTLLYTASASIVGALVVAVGSLWTQDELIGAFALNALITFVLAVIVFLADAPRTSLADSSAAQAEAREVRALYTDLER